MKHLLFIAFIAAWAMVSCTGGSTSKDEKTSTDSDSIALSSDTPTTGTTNVKEIVGTIGEGTSMNELEIISDRGDTLYIDFNCNMVTGSVQTGDYINLLYQKTAEGNIGTLAINLSALQHLWTRVGTDESLEINERGNLSTYNLKGTVYDHWRLSNGQLLLHAPKQPGTEKAAYTDTFDILQLTPDTLVLGKGQSHLILWREN